MCSRLCERMTRLKSPNVDLLSTALSRCLTTVDLTLLGLGYMIGPGLYVVTGPIVASVAGPGAILSYLVAGIGATLSAVCYAEFGSRVPLAGSAYTYTYVTMGEFWAFAIGWNMVLEYLIAAASSAKAWSATLDAMCDGAISDGVEKAFGTLNATWLSPYLDIIAFGVVLIAMATVIVGTRVSANVNNVLTFLILGFIVFIIGDGLSLADIHCWTNTNNGGFLPFGWSGVFSGAATCFYAYLGFDGIAVAGEETKNPKRSIPIATGLSMLVATLLYCLATATLTLMVPFYDVNTMAPFPIAFKERGESWAKYVVSVGALLGITTSITGGLYFLPRIVYAMSTDGLFFKCFGAVWTRTQTPALSILTFGLLAGLMASLISLDVLVELMSIGTLISFTFVSASVLILRYKPHKRELPEMPDLIQGRTRTYGSTRSQSASSAEIEVSVREESPITDSSKLSTDTQIFLQEKEPQKWYGGSCKCSRICRPLRSFLDNTVVPCLGGVDRLVIAILMTLVTLFTVAVLVLLHVPAVWEGQSWVIPFYLAVTIATMLCMAILLSLDQHNETTDSFQVPCVPITPVLSIFVNVAMLLHLSYLTWIRLVIWMTVGSLLYFFYGIKNSKENHSTPDSNGMVPTLTDVTRKIEASLDLDISKNPVTEKNVDRPDPDHEPNTRDDSV